MFEVWSALGDDLTPGPRFRALADAERYVSQPEHTSDGIRNPDGSWHRLPQGESAIFTHDPAQSPRRPRPRRSGRPARILVVDDHAGSREALAGLLEDDGYEPITAKDGADALVKVAEQPPDLIITDVVMPNADGFALVSRLRQRSALSDTPIILISGIDDDSRRVDGLDLGADDYLPKPLDPDELLARIRVHLRHAFRSREIIARSATDELTGLLNRAGILQVLERERERARRDGTPLAVLVVDVDDFKSINDTYGHNAGDVVLRCIADDIVRAVRINDRVGRYGGDEFLVVAPNTGMSAVEIVAERIKRSQRRPLDLGNGVMLTTSVSVGSAVDHGDMDMKTLFNSADVEMYRYKRTHKSAG
jgi:diguanylate cyclase (GGDEF)-like protein